MKEAASQRITQDGGASVASLTGAHARVHQTISL